jgi:FdhD protein
MDATARLHAPLRHDGREDRVAIEEPLEIRVGGEALAVTMRTPGHDEELAVGFLHGEGLLGELLLAREDVGRHNAMDKVVGRRALDGELPLHGLILCVSGRLSFELVQKAAVAGAPVLVGVGAPTSLAVSLAADRGLTLAGFARRGTVNVYTGEQRVT